VSRDETSSAAVNVAAGGAGPLSILSEPVAEVRLDGQAVGRTPLLFERVTAGVHEVELTHPRYQTRTLEVVVPGRVDVTLLRPPAKLRVTSSPSGAEVRLNGTSRGRTPIDIDVDAFEHYPIDIALAGYRTWHKRLYIRATEDSLHAQLEPMR
jgi:hypothetical protein